LRRTIISLKKKSTHNKLKKKNNIATGEWKWIQEPMHEAEVGKQVLKSSIKHEAGFT
jgi:hypothetical protein